MKFLKHPQETREIGKPENWNEELQGECSSISVSDKIIDGYRVMESRLQPSQEELSILLNGGYLVLGIYGSQHPVIYIGAEGGEEPKTTH